MSSTFPRRSAERGPSVRLGSDELHTGTRLTFSLSGT